MSNWQGFDQRQICPKCGDYHTSAVTKERPSLSSSDVRFSLLRFIGVAVSPIIVLFLLYLRSLNGYLLVLFFVGFLGLVYFFAYRRIYPGEQKPIDQQFREENQNGFSLHCRNCGYAWEMSAEEWETAGQKERENFMNSPSRLLPSNGSSNESSDRMEWKRHNPNMAIFIMIGIVVVSLILPLLFIGVFWAKANPDHPYAIIVNYFATIFAVFIFDGLYVLVNPKTNKIVLVILTLVILIGLTLAALRH